MASNMFFRYGRLFFSNGVIVRPNIHVPLQERLYEHLATKFHQELKEAWFFKRLHRIEGGVVAYPPSQHIPLTRASKHFRYTHFLFMTPKTVALSFDAYGGYPAWTDEEVKIVEECVQHVYGWTPCDDKL